jgi:hypothetical protein
LDRDRPGQFWPIGVSATAKLNEHNALVPRDHWLPPEGKLSIIAFHERFPLEDYWRLAFMMIDQERCRCLVAEKHPIKSATASSNV